MAELFVMCPECKLHAKLRTSSQEVLDPEARCKHRQNPNNCPNLAALLSSARKILEWHEDARAGKTS